MPIIKKFSLLDLIINSSQVHSSIEMIFMNAAFHYFVCPLCFFHSNGAICIVATEYGLHV